MEPGEASDEVSDEAGDGGEDMLFVCSEVRDAFR